MDHLGLYHLVMFRGLGTAWSRDPSLLSALPSNEEAAQNWLVLRDELLAHGFHQTTLTNFERAEFRGDDRRFLYEECSFQTDRFDMLGFGPSAITFAARADFHAALKVVNPDGSADYQKAVAANQPAWDRSFSYGSRDLRVFHLTRRLAALSIERRAYRRRFGIDPVDDFPSEFAALRAEALIEMTPEAIRPTPRGMFYADSIAALLAWRQLRAHRRWELRERSVAHLRTDETFAGRRINYNGYGHM